TSTHFKHKSSTWVAAAVKLPVLATAVRAALVITALINKSRPNETWRPTHISYLNMAVANNVRQSS
ncbi:hypothetical protein C7212DRAFT_335453, partial [Tuber magnatum]